MTISSTKRHPNNTKTDQLPIFEVITGLPRPYHNTSGNLRMLLLIVLVLEFESRRGEILNLFTKIKKDQQLRAPINSVGRHISMRVDEGRKG